MYLSPKIKYVGLDFDNVICELNGAFHILWRAIAYLDQVGVLDKSKFLPHYARELEETMGSNKVTTLNAECLMLLKHIAHMPDLGRPTVFIYTNNTNAELVQFVHDWIELALRRDPWSPNLVFHPQDHRRILERPLLAPDEPGKSFEGMRACMNFPDDFQPETVLFVDDKIHGPAYRDLGANYIHHDPPYECKDQMRPYIQAFFRAYRKLGVEKHSDKDFSFRFAFRDFMKPYVRSCLDYFYAFQDLYIHWDCRELDDYENLFLDTPPEILARQRERQFGLYNAVKHHFPFHDI